MEIYNETVRDLLVGGKSKGSLKITSDLVAHSPCCHPVCIARIPRADWPTAFDPLVLTGGQHGHPGPHAGEGSTHACISADTQACSEKRTRERMKTTLFPAPTPSTTCILSRVGAERSRGAAAAGARISHPHLVALALDLHHILPGTYCTPTRMYANARHGKLIRMHV